MTLQQKDSDRRKLLENQIKTVNLDVSILNGISKQNKVVNSLSMEKTAKLSLNQLAQVLKNKNQKYHNLKTQKQQAKQWLKEKGINLRKLNEEVAENARVSAEFGIFQEQKKIETQALDASSFRRAATQKAAQEKIVVGFTADSQSQFINKQKNVIINKAIINSMRKIKPKNEFRNSLLEKIKESLANNKADTKSFYQNKPQIPICRNEEQLSHQQRKNYYFDFVQSLTKYVGVESFQKLKKIKSFWKIVLEHVKAVQNYTGKITHSRHDQPEIPPIDQTQLRLNASLMYKSLKMIEQQFSQSLPNTANSYEKLDQMIESMKRKNPRLQIWRNSNGEPSWARALILLRAGRINEVKRVLQHVDKEFLENMLRHQQTLAVKPQRSFKTHETSKYKDNFYKQLLYILEAKQKFDPQIIKSDNLTKTKLWILIRTIGIHRQDPETQARFNQLGQMILNSQVESDQKFSLSKAQEFLYLGLYSQLIMMVQMILQHQNGKELGDFNYDDYFHLLTVIYFFPQLWGNTSPRQKNRLQEKFVSALKQYITKLRKEGYNKEVTKYIMLCPPQKIKELLSEFIANKQQYSEFDWQSLKHHLKQRSSQRASSIYVDLSKYVLDSLHLTTFEDFLFAADLYKSTFSSVKNSWVLEQKNYVKLLMKHLYFVEKKKYLVLKNRLNQDFTGEMFKFFEITPQEATNEEKLQKKDELVKKKVAQCERILQNNIDWASNALQYVQNITRPFLFYKKFNELANAIQNPYEKFIYLKNFEHNQIYRDLNSPLKFSEHTQHLLQFFRSQFQNEITSIYVYYLNALIERKRILSTKECDYSGLSSYIVNILQGLQKLDQSYQQKAWEFGEVQGRLMAEEEMQNQAQKYQNQLKLCDEYECFVRELENYLFQYGGTYALEINRNSEELRSQQTKFQRVRSPNFGGPRIIF